MNKSQQKCIKAQACLDVHFTRGSASSCCIRCALLCCTVLCYDQRRKVAGRCAPQQSIAMTFSMLAAEYNVQDTATELPIIYTRYQALHCLLAWCSLHLNNQLHLGYDKLSLPPSQEHSSTLLHMYIASALAFCDKAFTTNSPNCTCSRRRPSTKQHPRQIPVKTSLPRKARQSPNPKLRMQKRKGQAKARPRSQGKRRIKMNPRRACRPSCFSVKPTVTRCGKPFLWGVLPGSKTVLSSVLKAVIFAQSCGNGSIINAARIV